MSDLYTQRDQARRLEQTQVIERPGNSGYNTFVASGTFTAAFSGSGGGGSFTQTLAIGEYTRIGTTVHVWIHVSMNTFTSAPAGNLWVSGLPFTARNTANQFYPVVIGYRNTALASIITALIPANTTHMDFRDTTGANVAASLLSAASELILSATYPI